MPVERVKEAAVRVAAARVMEAAAMEAEVRVAVERVMEAAVRVKAAGKVRVEKALSTNRPLHDRKRNTLPPHPDRPLRNRRMCPSRRPTQVHTCNAVRQSKGVHQLETNREGFYTVRKISRCWKSTEQWCRQPTSSLGTRESLEAVRVKEAVAMEAVERVMEAAAMEAEVRVMEAAAKVAEVRVMEAAAKVAEVRVMEAVEMEAEVRVMEAAAKVAVVRVKEAAAKVAAAKVAAAKVAVVRVKEAAAMEAEVRVVATGGNGSLLL